jgi:hypothetical protein
MNHPMKYILLVIFLAGCNKDSSNPSADHGSGHSEPKLRTVYNGVAATQLDGQGKVKPSPTFPDSSLIVKELLNSDGSLSRIAVLFKLRTATNKDDNGWVWAEYGPEGSILYSVDNRGAGCIGCHGAGVDETRMNDAHP